MTDLRQKLTDRRLDHKTDFDYDGLNRLTSSEADKTADSSRVDHYAYDYDKASNMTHRTHNGSDTWFRHNDNNELECSYAGAKDEGSDCPSGGRTYAYDDAGNLTGSSSGLQIGIDAKNHTASVTPPGGEALDMSYASESQVERTKRGSTSFLQNALGLSLLSESETQTTALTRDDRGAVQGHRTDDNSERFYYLTDAIGSVVAVTDGQGAVRSRYEYDPFGQTKPQAEGRAFEDSAPAGRALMRFQGQLLDRESGFYKMGHRYYAPTIAEATGGGGGLLGGGSTGSSDQGVGNAAYDRWSQVDPLNQFQDPRQGNRYVYAACDPVNLSDPTGEFSLTSALTGCLFTGTEAFGLAPPTPQTRLGFFVGGCAIGFLSYGFAG